MKVLFLIIPFLFITLTGCFSIGKQPVNEKNSVSKSKTNENQSQNEPSTEPSSKILIQQIVTDAKDGKVKASEFAAHTTSFEDVKSKFGPPSTIDKINDVYYATYPNRRVTFGYNEKMIIFDIRSYDTDFKKITLTDIEKELGKCKDVRTNNQDEIYVYQVNQQFQLKFIIPQSTGVVDHISVYSESDAQVKREVNSENTNYVLEILGRSNQLSNNAWKSMQSWRQEMVTFTEEHANSVYLNGANKKMVALTFDDGPDNKITPKIVDILKKYHVKGNFFFNGNKVIQYPETVKYAYQNGNLILSHGYTHEDLTKKTDAEIVASLKQTSDAIANITSKKPSFLRPPYGDTNDRVVSLAKQNGYKIVLWSIDTLDWSQMESGNIQNNVLDNVRNGDIILMHSNSDKIETAKALPTIIEELQKRNFEIVDLITMLH